jgi:hypothetical protein
MEAVPTSLGYWAGSVPERGRGAGRAALGRSCKSISASASKLPVLALPHDRRAASLRAVVPKPQVEVIDGERPLRLPAFRVPPVFNIRRRVLDGPLLNRAGPELRIATPGGVAA